METNTYCSKGYWDIVRISNEDREYPSNIWSDEEEILLLEELNNNSKKKTEIDNVFINENDYIELQNDVKNMKNDIKQIKNTLEELVEMMKFVYDEDT